MGGGGTLVTLTTDFGTGDPFVAAMKGVVLGINPHAQVVDVTHEVIPHDVLDGAFRLRCAFPYFPPGTIHVAVVDPGVGSDRRALLMVTRNHRFLAPDNGLLGLVPEAEAVSRVYHLTAAHYFRPRVSATFHGRDVFAPAAAWLSRGVDPEHLGEPVDDWVRRQPPRPRLEGTTLSGTVLSVDRFGNLITGIPVALVEELRARAGGALILEVGDRRIEREVTSYHEIPHGELGFLVNSADLVEVAAPQDSAARRLDAGRGESVRIHGGAPRGGGSG